MNKIVSVIIPIYNVEKQIRRCIESIMAQTYHNLEIILVDDGSTDNCPQICDDYARIDSRIKVIHKVNGGPTDAKNIGLSVVTGDYVYILSGDDYVANTLIEVAVENAVATSADLVLFSYNKIDEFDNLLSPVRLKPVIEELGDHNRMAYIIKNLQQYKSGWEVGNRLFKADLIRKNNLFFWDNRLIQTEDLAFSLNYVLHVNRISCVPEVLYYYRIRNGSDRSLSPTKPMLFEANELCKLLGDRVTNLYNNSKMDKEFSILYFALMNEQLSKLNYYNYSDALSSLSDKKLLYEQNRKLITKFISLIRYYGTTQGIAFLIQCIFTSRKIDKTGIFVIHINNKVKKISETFQYNKTKPFTKKRLFLIGCEDFWNLGDHHIAISELEYLHKILPDYAIIEIAASRYFAVNRLLPLIIRRKDIIFMHGGGNIGNFYMLAEQIRRDLMKRFRNNEKIIFPQTIHYDCSDVGKVELEKDQSSIKKTKNLTLCIRERYSYELAKQYFDCNVLLTPDIVLFSNYIDRFKMDRKGVILLLRNDLEGIMSGEEKQLIEKIVQRYTSEIRINDTQLIIDISVYDRREVVEEFVRKIAGAEFVITDRLHGMVFCAITKTPCIVLPNYNHKVEGVYEWLSKSEYIIMINQLSELEEAIKKLLIIERIVYDNLAIHEGFDVLTKLLRSKIK